MAKSTPFLLVLVWTLIGVAQSDWVNEMRLTLANYALRKAINPPPGFLCTVEGKKSSMPRLKLLEHTIPTDNNNTMRTCCQMAGKKHDSCHCWKEVCVLWGCCQLRPGVSLKYQPEILPIYLSRMASLQVDKRMMIATCHPNVLLIPYTPTGHSSLVRLHQTQL